MTPHAHPIRVYYEDTDAGGVAYHATYLRWAERGRTEALRDLGLPHSDMQDRHGTILVVRRLEVEYLRPARLDEALTVETAVARLGGASVVLDQAVRRAADTLATLRVTLVCVDVDTMRPAPIPAPWHGALRDLLPA